MLARLALPIFVVTNQSCIGRGLVPQVVVEDIHARMVQIIHQHGGRVDEVAFCPHVPDDGCDCRKPRPGLLVHLAQKYHLDLSCSFFIGDALSDAQVALAVGAQPILLAPGPYRKGFAVEAIRELRGHVVIVPDFSSAIEYIRVRIVQNAGLREGK